MKWSRHVQTSQNNPLNYSFPYQEALKNFKPSESCTQWPTVKVWHCTFDFYLFCKKRIPTSFKSTKLRLMRRKSWSCWLALTDCTMLMLYRITLNGVSMKFNDITSPALRYTYGCNLWCFVARIVLKVDCAMMQAPILKKDSQLCSYLQQQRWYHQLKESAIWQHSLFLLECKVQ